MIRTLRSSNIGLCRSRLLQSSFQHRFGAVSRVVPTLTRWNSTGPKPSESPKNTQGVPNINLETIKPAPKIIPPEVHENLYTLPNLLTFSRLLSAPLIGYFVIQHEQVLATSLFVYSCVTDMLDGYIARKYNMKSVVGSVIDPLADKFLMITLTVCLAAAGEMPLYLTTLILGRDISLGISAFYYRYISLPPPKTFTRYWDFSIPSAEVNPTTISKYNTAFQMLYIGLVMSKPVISTFADMAAFDAGMTYYGYFVGATTFLSGLSYVFSKNAVKILPHPQNSAPAGNTKPINIQGKDSSNKNGLDS